MSESENILRRLKEQTPYTNVLDGELMKDAASAIEALRAENEKLRADVALWAHKRMAHDSRLIERLRAENEKLRAALKPFADRYAYALKYCPDKERWQVGLDELRAATAALKETGE